MFLRVLTALIVCGAVPTMGYGQCILGNGSTQNATTVYFANGMMNTLADAENSRRRLEREYANLTLPQAVSRYEFGISYNPSTHDLAEDVRRALLQKAEQENWRIGDRDARARARGLARQLVAGETVDRMLTGLKLFLPNLELAQDDLIEVVDTATEYFEDAFSTQVDPETVATHVECYLKNLGEGKRVIVVAHSQGNLYANEALDAVAARMPGGAASIAILGVATPAARIAGNGSGYVTAKDDVIVNVVRRIPGATVLKANVDNDPGLLADGRDLWNHAFGRSYFDSELESRAMIDKLMNTLAAQLPFP